MANTRSAAKQARMSLRRRTINQSRTSKMRNVEKSIREMVSKGDKEGALKLIRELQSRADKSAKGKSIHRNKANRIKSRVSKLLKK